MHKVENWILRPAMISCLVTVPITMCFYKLVFRQCLWFVRL